MTWRTISHQGRSWTVHPATERRSSTADWQLIFGFRPAGDRSGRILWAMAPITALDKASLLRRADLVTDSELAALLDGIGAQPGG